jgi:hypothetical protein
VDESARQGLRCTAVRLSTALRGIAWFFSVLPFPSSTSILTWLARFAALAAKAIEILCWHADCRYAKAITLPGGQLFS